MVKPCYFHTVGYFTSLRSNAEGIPIGALVHVPAVPLPIQLPADGLEKAVEDD